MTTILGLTAVLLYLGTAALMTYRGRKGKPYGEVKLKLTLVASCALLCHAILNLNLLHVNGGLDLGFFNIASTTAWFVASITLSSSIRAPIDKLLIPVYILAALTIIAVLLAQPGSSSPHDTISSGVGMHILLSVLAYSVMTIGAFQAVFLALQNHQLRAGHLHGVINALPPLQTMEQLLFQILMVGEILLTLSILSGVLYLDDIFAQHLAHKSFFAIVAWLIFAMLLWGRHQLGWRGQVAARGTLLGFAILMLAFFGSKFVLELILQR